MFHEIQDSEEALRCRECHCFSQYRWFQSALPSSLLKALSSLSSAPPSRPRVSFIQHLVGGEGRLLDSCQHAFDFSRLRSADADACPDHEGRRKHLAEMLFRHRQPGAEARIKPRGLHIMTLQNFQSTGAAMQFDPKRSDFTLGIIGTGAMGRGIAQVATTGGMRVLMCDARAGAAAEAKAFVAKMLERAVEKGTMTQGRACGGHGAHRGGRRPRGDDALPPGDRGHRREPRGEAARCSPSSRASSAPTASSPPTPRRSR